MKGQLTGMRGVYLVAAELSRLGFIASPTSRSAQGADILVTDQVCQRAFSVQVKTNAVTFGFWLTGKRTAAADTHVYVLVNLRSKDGNEKCEYFVVPSNVAEKIKIPSKTAKATFWSIYRKDVLGYKDKWDVFGDPHAQFKAEDSLENSMEDESPSHVSDRMIDAGELRQE